MSSRGRRRASWLSGLVQGHGSRSGGLRCTSRRPHLLLPCRWGSGLQHRHSQGPSIHDKNHVPLGALAWLLVWANIYNRRLGTPRLFLCDRLFADTRTPLYIFRDMIVSWGGRHPAKPLLDSRHETVCFPLPGFGVHVRVCVEEAWYLEARLRLTKRMEFRSWKLASMSRQPVYSTYGEERSRER